MAHIKPTNIASNGKLKEKCRQRAEKGQNGCFVFHYACMHLSDRESNVALLLHVIFIIFLHLHFQLCDTIMGQHHASYCQSDPPYLLHKIRAIIQFVVANLRASHQEARAHPSHLLLLFNNYHFYYINYILFNRYNILYSNLKY